MITCHLLQILFEISSDLRVEGRQTLVSEPEDKVCAVSLLPLGVSGGVSEAGQGSRHPVHSGHPQRVRVFWKTMLLKLQIPLLAVDKCYDLRG